MSHPSSTPAPDWTDDIDANPRGDVLTAEQVAQLLQVRPCTVADWARRGIIPSYKLGKFRRYSKKDISAWVIARRQSSIHTPPHG